MCMLSQVYDNGDIFSDVHFQPSRDGLRATGRVGEGFVVCLGVCQVVTADDHAAITKRFPHRSMPPMASTE